MTSLPPSELEKQAEAALAPVAEKAADAAAAVGAEAQAIGDKAVGAVLTTGTETKALATEAIAASEPVKLVEQLPTSAWFRLGELYTHATAVLGHLAQVAEAKLEAEEKALVNGLKADLEKVQETARKLYHSAPDKP